MNRLIITAVRSRWPKSLGGDSIALYSSTEYGINPSHMYSRLATIFLIAFAVTVNADVEAGRKAYLRGDYDTAKAEFSALAEKGDAGAQAWLGIFYLRGMKDERKAAEWFEKAAEQGVVFAQLNLGWLYGFGSNEYVKGLPRNFAKAAYWYRRAADQGSVQAQAILGSMYYFGEGMPRDVAQAFFWLDLAALQGHPEAREFRDSLAKEMSAEQISKSRQQLREWRPQREYTTRKTDDPNNWTGVEVEGAINGATKP